MTAEACQRYVDEHTWNRTEKPHVTLGAKDYSTLTADQVTYVNTAQQVHCN